ncbi:hypothetical protein ACSSVV_001708 [Marinobacter sp. MBR-105]|jgi:hypothetical protein
MKRNTLRVLNALLFVVLSFSAVYLIMGDIPIRQDPKLAFDIWLLGPLLVIGGLLSLIMVEVDRLLTGQKKH